MEESQAGSLPLADTNNNDDSSTSSATAASNPQPTSSGGLKSTTSNPQSPPNVYPRDYYDRRYTALQYYKQMQQQQLQETLPSTSGTSPDEVPPLIQSSTSSSQGSAFYSQAPPSLTSFAPSPGKASPTEMEQMEGVTEEERMAPSPPGYAPSPRPDSPAENVCQFCGKSYSDIKELQQHLVLHLGKKPYKCEHCGKRYRGKTNLQFHTKTAHSGINDSQSETVSKMDEGPSPATHPLDSALQRRSPSSTTSTTNHTSTLQKTDQSGSSAPEAADTSDAPLDSKPNGEVSAMNSSCLSPNSSMGSLEKEVGVLTKDSDSSVTVEFPSMFPGLKHKISIKNEVVMVTRMDGMNLSTGSKASLFKCHLCNKIYGTMSRLQCHLSVHFDRHMTLYQCTFCDSHFQFKTQLLQHLRCYHDTQLSPTDDLPEADELFADDAAAKSVSSLSSTSSTGGGPGPSQEEELMETGGSRKRKLPRGARELFVCQFCHRTFDRLYSLHRHERVHTGVKPCYCSYCGKGFSEPRNLRHHVIRYHSDGSQAHHLRRLRQHSGDSSRSASQRLKMVSPDDVESKEDKMEDMEGEDKEEELEPGELPRKSAHLVSLREEDSNLTDEIREQERLGEDVTVVIPSDAPLEGKSEGDLHTPKSTASDNTSWSGGVSEGDGDGSSTGPSGEIVSAPLKSIMGLQQWKAPRRKPSLGHQRSTPEIKVESEEMGPITPPFTCGPSSQSPITPPTPQSAGMEHKPPLSLAAHLPSALGLPFSPLNISTLGMAGLLPSPIISPLYGQPNLSSPPMLTNPLSLYTHFPGIPATTAAAVISKTDTPSTSQAPPHQASTSASQSRPKSSSPQDLAEHSASNDTSPTDAPPHPAWIGGGRRSSANSASASSNMVADNGKGVSSLSRTHSRLYVVRQPIKREDACKPTMLPNGRMVYRCTYCNKEFCTVSDVNRHMDFHEDIRPYKCKFCDYYARTNSQLKVHMMRHQGIREFHCRLCSYKGVTQSDLNRHMKSQIHMMKARNECKHCGEGFVSPMNLEKHYHEKHFSQYEHLGGAALAAANMAVSSVREVPPRKPRHECKLCGEGFMSPLELEKHYHDKHYTQYRQFLNQASGPVPH